LEQIFKYPLFGEGFALICRYENSMVYPISMHDLPSTDYLQAYFSANKVAAEILLLCNGLHTTSDIINVLCERYQDEVDNVTSLVVNFLQDSKDKGYLYFADFCTEHNIRVYGDFSLQTPITANIEVTNGCPLKCLHCFNNSGAYGLQELDTGQLFLILDTLNLFGIPVVTLTGGEPTQRSDFLEIVRYASQRFARVIISSNGYLLTDKIASALSCMQSNIVVQISLDGVENNHNMIRGKDDSFQKATDAISMLRERGVPTTVATTINAINYGDMGEIAELVNGLDGLALSFTTTFEEGRARQNGLSHKVDINRIVSQAKDLKDFYRDKGLLILVDDALNRFVGEQDAYCNAGVGQITIRFNGDVAPCASFGFSYGNLLRDDPGKLFSLENLEIFRRIPNPSMKLCGDCEEIVNCNFCPARAFSSPLSLEKCAWKMMLLEVMPNML